MKRRRAEPSHRSSLTALLALALAVPAAGFPSACADTQTAAAGGAVQPTTPPSPPSQPLRHPDLEGVELAAELEVTVEAVLIRAAVRNGGERPVVIMAPPGGEGSPLVDADRDGSVAIRDQVVGAATMTPTAPIAIRATVLRPGEELRREATVARPFVRRWPDGYADPDAAPLPESPAAVRYCLGLAELSLLPGNDAVDADGGLEVTHGNALALEAQRLLCTEPVPLPPSPAAPR